MHTEEFAEAQRRLLDRYRVDAVSRLVEIDGPIGRAHVLDAGAGDPLVLLHGGGSFAGHWAPLMAGLRGRRLLAIDRPGHGLSDPFVYSRTVDVRAHAVTFLENVLDALEIERAAIVANSMGGLWAFWLALDRPDRVGPIAQMGCPAVLLDSNAPLGLRLATAPLLGRLMAALEPPSRKQVGRLLARLGDPIVALREPELVEAMVAAQPVHAEAWMSLVARFTGPLRRREISLGAEELRGVRRPVRFLWGTRDPFGGPALGRRAAELLPDARIDVVDAGHLPWLAQPDRALQTVRELLEKSIQHV